MWRKREQPRKRTNFLPFVIFRLCLSLVILSIFVVALYQAFRYFSGMDPVKMDPKSIAVSLLTSEQTVKTISDFLGFKVDTSPLQKVVGKNNPDPKQTNAKLSFKFALIADSHNNNEDLSKALQTAKNDGAKFVIGLGDYTDVGTVEDMQKVKEVFVNSALPYYLTAGDHDMWNARDKKLSSSISDFNEVFGTAYQSFTDTDVRFVILSDADNYEGVDPIQMAWFKDALVAGKDAKLILAFMHEPLYHPSSDHYVGKTNPQLKKQAEEIINLMKESKVSEVFFGDAHAFTRYSEPASGLKMTTVGAVTRERNTQTPRFAEVSIYEDGSHMIEDKEIK